MKLIRNLIVLLLLTITSSIYCQVLLPLKETNLPAPTTFSLKYFQTLSERYIFYGKKPPKPNGKVVLFVPGYIEEADFLLIGNSFYKLAYDEGYQAVFLSMTRGQGDWINGEILSQAIDQVKAKYKVNQIDIVAHSNGGKASEAALFHYGKDKSVRRVITLGTPFRGTQIADFAAIVPISWVTNILGLDSGRAYSTTYYCDNEWRPYFDKKTTATQKAKYYNYGSWGYLYGRKILFSGAMAVTGAIIKINGGGANDGVTPFYSSKKPGGKQLFALGTSEGKMDHMDMVYGEYVWKNIRNILASNASKITLKSAETSPIMDNSFSASSNFQILTETSILNNLQQDKGATNLDITLIKENPNASFNLIDNTINDKTPFDSNNMLRSSSKAINQNIDELSISFKNKNLRSTNENTVENKKFSIDGDSRFVAFAKQDIDQPMVYKFYNKNSSTKLEVDFPTLNNEDKSKISVTAKIYYIGSLDGKVSDWNIEKDINFSFDGNKFTYDTRNEEDGIYSMFLTGKIENAYKRDLISGFTVGNLSSLEPISQRNSEQSDIIKDNLDLVSIYPIPAKDNLNVSANEDILYVISDIQGRKILSGKLQSGNSNINLQGLANGIYFFKAQSSSYSKTIKFLIK